jgi:hypothetical protein
MITKSAKRLTPVLTLLAPGLVLFGAVMILDPGTQLERELNSAALAQSQIFAEAAVPEATPARPVLAAKSPEEGSEAFWLTRAPASEGVARVAWTAPVAPGDRIVVNFGAYDRQVLEVVAIAEDDARSEATRIDTGASDAPRFVLTCRKVSSPDASLVRLTVDPDGRGITMVDTGNRSL